MKVLHRHFESIDSTNTYAKEHAPSFDLETITVISADEQTKGRGRQEKRWLSPAKRNCIATFSLFSLLGPGQSFIWAELASILLKDFLETYGILCQIKWPNDLLVAGKKISGILVETQTVHNNHQIIIGIGLNVNMGRDEMEALPNQATSMAIASNRWLDLPEVRGQLISAVASGLHDFRQNPDIAAISKRWQSEVLWMVGTEKTIATTKGCYSGTIQHIAPDGTIELMDPLTGTCRLLNNGDIL